MLLYLWPKFFKKHVRSSSYLLQVFFKENLLNGYFYYSSFISKFLNRYFQELLFVAGERKIKKMYQQKLKLAYRLWALEIAYLKLCLCRQLFYIRQTSQFSEFYRVSLAELPNKLRGKSTTPTTSKQELFVTLVTTVNCCHKEIYYRC